LQKDIQVTSAFALLGPLNIKVARKTMVKLTPGRFFRKLKFDFRFKSLPVSPAHHPVGGHVTTEDLLHGLSDLAHRATGAGTNNGKAELEEGKIFPRE